MRLEAEEERLVVVSDLHLGSPASRAAHTFPQFVRGLSGTGWNLCINGDAFDFLQGSTRRLAHDALVAVRALAQFHRSGGRIYYTLGNHDLPLEHFLADLPITVVPFLNLASGGRRIRIEHGHLHEPAYLKWPRLYHFGGWLGRYLLAANADVYRLWSRMQRRTDAHRRRTPDDYPYYVAARDLFARGFDAVVFGHTHLPERSEHDGGVVVNAGDWMRRPTFARIESGNIDLVQPHTGTPLGASLAGHN